MLLALTLYCSAIVCTTLIGQNEAFFPQDPSVQQYEVPWGWHPA